MNASCGDFGITPLLYRVAHNCVEEQNKWMKDLSISAPQAAILGIIEFLGDGEINQKTVSDKIGVKEASVSSIIKTMINKGLINKEKSKTDGRNYILKITEKGRKISGDIKENADEFENYFYKMLDENEKESLKNILIKLINKM